MTIPFLTNANAAGGLTAGADAQQAAGRHARLVSAAQQFEALMLGELMRPLGTSAALGKDEESGDQSALQSFGVEAMAGAMARSGALGFARSIVHAMEQRNLSGVSQKSTGAAQVSSAGADNSIGGSTP